MAHMVRQQDVYLCVCECVCPASHTKGQRLLPGCMGWTLEQYMYLVLLSVLSKVRGLSPQESKVFMGYAFHPSRSLVLVLVRRLLVN